MDQALDRQEVGAGQLPATGWVQGTHTHREAAGKDFPLPKGTNTVDKKSMKKQNKAVTLASGQSARVREQIPIQNCFN